MYDITAAYRLLSRLLKNLIVIGDKGYISSKLEEFLKKLDIKLSPIFKKSMQNDDEQSGKLLAVRCKLHNILKISDKKREMVQKELDKVLNLIIKTNK